MTTVRRFRAEDMFRFNRVNLDHLTETYNFQFYFHYLYHWPEYQECLESPSGEIMGYCLGKVEGRNESWHGHVTALTVSTDYRKLGLAKRLMASLEDISQERHNAYFVDLFVRQSNELAIAMYTRLGYEVFRKVKGYYSGEEDAYDMRKPLKRDVNRQSLVTDKREVLPEELRFD